MKKIFLISLPYIDIIFLILDCLAFNREVKKRDKLLLENERKHLGKSEYLRKQGIDEISFRFSHVAENTNKCKEYEMP